MNPIIDDVTIAVINTSRIFFKNGGQLKPPLCLIVALYEKYQSGIHDIQTASADHWTPKICIRI